MNTKLNTKTASLASVLAKRVFVVCFIVLMAIAAGQAYFATQFARDLSTRQLDNDSKVFLTTIDQMIEQTLQQLQGVSQNELLINSIIDNVDSSVYGYLYLNTVAVLGNTSVGIALTDFRGQVITENLLGESMAFPPLSVWGKLVLEKGEAWVEMTSDSLFVAHPVYVGGFIEGAMLSEVPLAIFTSNLAKTADGYHHLLLQTDTYEVIFTSHMADWPIGSVKNEFNDQWVWSEPLFSIYGITAYTYTDSAQLKGIISQLLPLIITSLLLVAFSAVLIVLTSVKKVTYTLASLSKAIDRVLRSGDLTARVMDESNAKELESLSEQFNDMMARLQEMTTSRNDVDAILKSMTQTVIVTDLTEGVIHSNRPFSKNTQIDDLLGLGPKHALYAYDDLNSLQECEQVTPNKVTLWRKSPLIVGEHFSGWVFTGADITDIKQVQERLSIMELAIRNASHGVVIAKAEEQGNPLIFVNEGFARITGYHESELIGRPCNMLQGPETDPKSTAEITQGLASHSPVNVQILNYRKNGERFWNNLVIDPVFNKNAEVTHYLGLIHDITKDVAAREELKAAKQAAEEATLAKSQFLASMSHEIRTPMNGVLGMLSLLERSELTQIQQRHAYLAKSSAQSLLELINDILDFSKIEADKLVFETIPFDLKEMMTELRDTLSVSAHQKGIELNLDLGGIQVPRVKGDPGRFRQIVNNLVNNAIKFTNKGSIDLVFSQAQTELGWCITGQIRDTGIGIPADKLEALFDEFSQADASDTRKYGGTGLGLSIVRNLVGRMEGQVSVTSEVGKGSVFEFSVMLAQSTGEAVVSQQIELSGRHILVVEDNSIELDLYRHRLEKEGTHVTTVKNAEDAFDLCEQRLTDNLPLFDVVMIDKNLPFSNGDWLAQKIKSTAILAHIHLLLMTSYWAEYEEEQMAALGFDAYLKKPIKASHLIKALSVMLENGEALKQANPLITNEYLTAITFVETVIPTTPIIQLDQRVLLVEDNHINQLVAMGLLEPLNLNITCAGNGREAIERLKNPNEQYSLIFMDCQMPEMNGFEATKAIRQGKAGEQYKEVPIIAMTANAMQGDRQRCFDSGMNDYLSKPLNPADLSEMLNAWLGAQVENNESDSNAYLVQHSEPNDSAGLSELINIEDWDETGTRQRLMGNETLLIKLIKSYLSGSAERVNALQSALLALAFQDAAQQAHTIKGIAANLGANKVQQAMLELEKALVGEMVDQCHFWFEQFQQAEQAVCGIFNDFVAAREGSSIDLDSQAGVPTTAQFKDTHQFKELYTKLKRNEFVDANDYSVLHSQHNSPKVALLCTELTQALDQFDSKIALKILDKISNETDLSLALNRHRHSDSKEP